MIALNTELTTVTRPRQTNGEFKPMNLRFSLESLNACQAPKFSRPQ